MQRDIIIVGGGIIGAAVAYALGLRGMGERVCIIERAQPAAAATSRAAALVTLVRDKPNLIALVKETYSAIARLEKTQHEDVGRHQSGALYVAPQSHHASLQALAQICAEHGISHRELDKAQALQHAPWLKPEAFDVAFFFEQEIYCDPYQLASAYLRGATRMGAKLLHGEVASIHQGEAPAATTQAAKAGEAEEDATTKPATKPRAAQGVTLADGTYLPASQIVVAAGAWSSLLAEPLGIALPMAPVRSQYWITQTAPHFARDGAIVLMPEIQAYARPEVGALIFGIREQHAVAANPRTLPADLSRLVFDADNPDGFNDLVENADKLNRYFAHFEQTGIAHHMSGPSCYTSDGALVLGEAEHISGLYFATGYNGGGIAFAAGMGRVIAELIEGVKPYTDIAAHRPERLGYFDAFAPEYLQHCATSRSNKTSG